MGGTILFIMVWRHWARCFEAQLPWEQVSYDWVQTGGPWCPEGFMASLKQCTASSVSGGCSGSRELVPRAHFALCQIPTALTHGGGKFHPVWELWA